MVTVFLFSGALYSRSTYSREPVRGCQHMASTQGYLKAKALLKEHFGNGLKISSAYIDKVRSWKAIRPKDTRALQDYHLFPRACCNAMDDVCYIKVLNLAKSKRVCFDCLGIGHISRDCKKRITCRVCGFKHPSILHVF